MKLNELLKTIDLDTVIWVSTSDNEDACIYFGEAGSITCGIMRKCTVRVFYPERYPAKFCIGITIIVEVEK